MRAICFPKGKRMLPRIYPRSLKAYMRAKLSTVQISLIAQMGVVFDRTSNRSHEKLLEKVGLASNVPANKRYSLAEKAYLTFRHAIWSEIDKATGGERVLEYAISQGVDITCPENFRRDMLCLGIVAIARELVKEQE